MTKVGGTPFNLEAFERSLKAAALSEAELNAIAETPTAPAARAALARAGQAAGISAEAALARVHDVAALASRALDAGAERRAFTDVADYGRGFDYLGNAAAATAVKSKRHEAGQLVDFRIELGADNRIVIEENGKRAAFDGDEQRLYREVTDRLLAALPQSGLSVEERGAIEQKLSIENDRLPFWPNERAHRAFVELITNSLRSIRDRGGQGGDIQVRAAVGGGNLRISFVDSGAGLKGLTDRQLFGQGSTTKRGAVKGTVGNGLYRSRRLLKELLGGSLTLTDNVASGDGPHGATATVTIPLR